MSSQHRCATAHPLDPAALPLIGRHLIEASAGTGKTFNITRLYLRLLLERQLPVQNILVMTFTKAATEELRGRIDRELRAAALAWGSLGANDPFFAVMEQQFSAETAKPLLEQAILHLDEAAIFTIHGFCARMLRQHALDSALALELEMEADTDELLLESVRDWLRGLAHRPEITLLSRRGWHQPEAFHRQFAQALRSEAPLLAVSPEQLLAGAREAQAEALALLQAAEAEFIEPMVQGHKDRQRRETELSALYNWLRDASFNQDLGSGREFLALTRCSGKNAPFKPLFSRVRDLLDQARNGIQDAADAEVFDLIRGGIEQIRQRFKRGKAEQGVIDFDDLVRLLAERVSASPALMGALRQQFPVALVDEFQDTDPAQYRILDRVYPRAAAGESGTALFMIGDPKQAIYAFRGGDIFTYLKARDGADYSWQMETNWRSLASMVRGYNRLFWGAALDQPATEVFGFDIDYSPVKAAKGDRIRAPALQDPHTPIKALNYVWFEADAEQVGTRGKPLATFRRVMANWMATEIHRLIETPVTLEGEPLQARDIAILVRDGTEAALAQEALQQAGYPSVYISARDNVLLSAEAVELEQVLNGILDCENRDALLAAESTHLLGGDARRLAMLMSDADALVSAREALAVLRNQWQRDGFIPMLIQLIHERLRPPPDRHERCLTNHLHLAELLQQAAAARRQPQHLLEWLREQRRLGGRAAEREQRLESDANLIRLITQHGSKGLEYPVVFVPFASYGKDPLASGAGQRQLYSFHDRTTGAACLQLGDSEYAALAHSEEAFAESIRLLYVAVTRAELRCYLGVANFENSLKSPLARALKIETDDDWLTALAQQRADEPDAIALLNIAGGDFSRAELLVTDAATEDDTLQLSHFHGLIERDWRLNSFSSLTRMISHSRREQPAHGDDTDAQPTSVADVTETLPLRFRLQRGARAGNLLHDLLEHCDFSRPQWSRLLSDPLARFGEMAEPEQRELTRWLEEVLSTPLPALACGEPFSLAACAQAQTLREAEFYFPLQQMQLPQLAALLAQHRGCDYVALPGPQQLRGMMHGFIDLIVEQAGRYYVLDYKSTHLGNRLMDYSPDRLKQNNAEHFYDLQYLIYSLALHRMLRNRRVDYDPECHFGGVYYLYLRGMQPGSLTESGVPTGVFATPIDRDLLLQLDALMQGEAA